MHTRLLKINDLAAILNTTAAAIHAHLARKNFKAVPPPIKLGHRLFWPEHALSAWLDEKVEQAQQERINAEAEQQDEKRSPGRPRKTRKHILR